MAARRPWDPIDASMHHNLPATGAYQAGFAFHDTFGHVLTSGPPLPQRPTPQPPRSSVSKRTALTSVIRRRANPIRHYGKDAVGFVPTEFTCGEGPSHLPGTASYYKSRAFQKKKPARNDQVRGLRPKTIIHGIESDDKHLSKRRAVSEKQKSLVIIFSKTNVRRESDNRMVHRRLQRYNRRMSFLRKVNGGEALFEWD